MLFRIVRINGDGTIRLIIESPLRDESTFNESMDAEKYVGYTYDNSKPNVQDGTNSTIKNYIENWYKSNLTIEGGADKEYSSVLASTRFCNDTTSTINKSGYLYYSPLNRINTNNEHTPEPTYICPNTDKTYGGEYDLKVGLCYISQK